VTGSKVEYYSMNWIEIKRRYEEEPCSIKALAREYETTDTRIRRHAKANNWKLYSAPQRGPQRATQRRPQRGNRQPTATLAETEIARETCGTLDALRSNLAAVVQDLRLARELADAETAGDDNPARARLVDKVLSLPGLIKAANDLTSAIARLADIGPGKKATAMDLAKSADSGLFATPAAPKRTLQ
jgi:hypothetical protein